MRRKEYEFLSSPSSSLTTFSLPGCHELQSVFLERLTHEKIRTDRNVDSQTFALCVRFHLKVVVFLPPEVRLLLV